MYRHSKDNWEPDFLKRRYARRGQFVIGDRLETVSAAEEGPLQLGDARIVFHAPGEFAAQPAMARLCPTAEVSGPRKMSLASGTPAGAEGSA
jgi:hypothetical protein